MTSAAEGDRLCANWQERRTTKFYFGNVAQDRWVWRIDFADTVDMSGARVMLYLDADNDITTGRREGAPGTDVRLICDGGAFSTAVQNSTVLGRDRDLRGYVDEQCLYFSIDVAINYTMTATRRRKPTAVALRWRGGQHRLVHPRHRSRDLPKRMWMMSQIRGHAAQRRWPAGEHPRTGAPPLEPGDAQLTGISLRARRWSWLSARAVSGAAGGDPHQPDQDSAEGREVTGRSAEVGRIVAGERWHPLFSTEKPVALTGALIEFAAAPAQDFRISRP